MAEGRPLWFSGVCDTLLAKVQRWLATYEQGEISRTRPFMELDGRVIDRPTQYAHKIAWHPREIDALVTILDAVQPGSSLAQDVKMVQAGVRRGRHLAGGQFLTTMLFWRSDVEAIVQVLEKVRAGKADGVQAFVEEAGGKPGLWKS